MIIRGDATRIPLPDCSVDAVVTDPPYGLEFMGKEWDAFKSDKRGVSRTGGVARPGIRGEWGARPSSYDAGKPFQGWCELWAAECLRVLKPGGHLLAFGGTRTYHRMTCAIEDAGFEVRDCLAWLYGSGFPKSLNVGLAIDKAAGAEREVVGRREYPRSPYKADGSRSEEGDPRWDSARSMANRMETAPATPEAQQWQGWGTAMKPAWENITVAVKPDPEGERYAIDSYLWLLGNRIASLSPANPAVSRSASSEAEHDAALLASAQWTAAERASTRDASSEGMDTSRFEWAISTSLSIVSSWLNTLAELCEPMSTSTIGTTSSTTTALRTLRSCLSGITPPTIIQALTSPGGQSFHALPVAQAFAAVESSLSSTRTLSALGRATSPSLTPSPGGGVDLEPIVLARKPLTGTVAQNVLRWGTGALNVDGTRLPTDENRTRFNRGRDNGSSYVVQREDGFVDPGGAGRWPPNVAMDEEAARLLDEQSGDSLSRGGSRGRAGVGWGMDTQPDVVPGYGDTGGASRFMQVVRADCTLATMLSGCESSPALGVESPSGTTPATGLDTADGSVLIELEPSLVRAVRSAGGLCASCGTVIARSLVLTLQGHDPASTLTQAGTSESDRSILTHSLALAAAVQGKSGTTPTTRSLTTLFGCVAAATSTSTTSAFRPATSESVRMRYTPKASRAERNAGLEGMPKRRRAAMQGNLVDGQRLGGDGSPIQTPEGQNHHPTVKPLALMRWLVRLVTPPNGLVLDPFLGSGSTLLACAYEGMRGIGIEREAEYVEIAKGRLSQPIQAGML